MSADFDDLVVAAKRAAAALREADIPFLLAGGLASWVRGGPATEHDVDFVLRPLDAERALQVLDDAGLRTERPPEEWLYKAYDGDVMIDLIFGPEGPEVDDAMFARAEDLPLQAVMVRVLSVDDILISKLMALTEHHLDYDGVLELARALQVLDDAGLRTERPPEEWLYKAYDGDVMIDLIFGPEGPEVDDAMFDRAEELPLQAVTVRVLAVDDILISKLMALTEHHLDYDGVLELARALREQIDWDRVRAETKASPYARAFFTLAEGLELA